MMKPKSFDGIMIVPCFNEANRFPLALWSEIILKETNWLWCFVDDGSKDQTEQILRKLPTRDNVRIIALSHNSGKAEAVRNGMNDAIHLNRTVPWVGYIDSDGAFSKDDISVLLNLASTESSQSFQIILASRVKLGGREINRKNVRHVLGRILATLTGFFWKGSPYDLQSGFKLFSNSSNLQYAIGKPFHSKWFLDLEIFIRISDGNFQNIKFWEQPLMYWQEVGKSKLTSFQVLRAIRDFLVLVIFHRRNA